MAKVNYHFTPPSGVLTMGQLDSCTKECTQHSGAVKVCRMRAYAQQTYHCMLAITCKE